MPLDIQMCGANRKVRIGDDEALLTKYTIYLLCKAGDKVNEYQLSFSNPLAREDGSLSWAMRYGSAEFRDRQSVLCAGHIDMLDHLVGEYSMKEVTDRLRRMRRAHRFIVENADSLKEGTADD